MIIQCYTSEKAIRKHVTALRQFFVDLGTQTNQGAVGFVIDRDYLEIQYPLPEKGT